MRCEHKFSIMSHRVNENDVSRAVNSICRDSELSLSIRQQYADESGIDLSFVDLRTAIRGFMMQGRLRIR